MRHWREREFNRAGFVLVLCCLLWPFVTLSTIGVDVTYSGADLVAGLSVGGLRALTDAQPYAIAAALMALAGAVLPGAPWWIARTSGTVGIAALAAIFLAIAEWRAWQQGHEVLAATGASMGSVNLLTTGAGFAFMLLVALAIGNVSRMIYLSISAGLSTGLNASSGSPSTGS